MKRLLMILLGLLPLCLQAQTDTPAAEKTFLHQGWTFRQLGTADWLPASVPGTVHTDLLHAGRIEDPFFRTNERKQQWIDKVDWEYRTAFRPTAAQLQQQHQELVFEGLDTYADVYLNGELLCKADNMFRRWSADVRGKLKDGDNELRIHFRSPIQQGLALLEANGHALPAANDQSQVGGVGESRVGVFLRKAGYHFGWDWGPRFVTSGIWKPVYLHAWSGLQLQDVFVSTTSIAPKQAQLQAQVRLQADKAGKAVLSLDFGTQRFERQVQLQVGENDFSFPLTLRNPKLWWSNGLGEPHLYQLTTTLRMGSDSHALRQQVGVRTLKLVRKPDVDGKGSSFHFELNGHPVFAKGANYIPSDSFLTRLRPQDYPAIVRLATDANMNMLRVWGGGIYEDDAFYEACDQQGILVWQDFMFACSMYPGDAAFLENVRQEASQQVQRLRKHACLALWCGNNEMDGAWSNYDERAGWGWKQQYTAQTRARIWADYEALFHKLLPEVVEQANPQTPYWASSPMTEDYWKTGNKPSHTGYDSPQGDMHYWGVWHGMHLFEDFEKYRARFMSEYGFQSFPDMEAVRQYAPQAEDWDIDSEVMASHQRSGIGNQRIAWYLGQYFRMPKGFSDMLYLSQVQQAYAIQRALEAHRQAMPYTMGTLYWQINDCWPVASWSSTDYYRRWKAQHYMVRDFYSPTIVSSVEKQGEVQVFVVTDKHEPLKGTLSMRLLDFSGRELWQRQQPLQQQGNSSQLHWKESVAGLLSGHSPANTLLLLELQQDGKTVHRKLHYFAKPKDQQLQASAISWQLEGDNTLQLRSEGLARYVWVQVEGELGQFTDNYFDMLPGEQRTIVYKGDKSLQQLKGKIRIHQLGEVQYRDAR